MIDAASVTHEVRLADCLGPDGLCLLPDKSVDHILTDPPYEAEAHEKVCRANTKGPGHGKSAIVEVQHDFLAITEEQRAAVSREMVRVCRGWVLVFCQIEAVAAWRSSLVAAGAKWRRGMIWVKPDAMPQVTGDRPGMWGECMALAWAGPGRSTWNGGGRSGRYEATKAFAAVHPTTKPLPLMETLVRDFTVPGDLIADPYCGSGSTIVAAKRLGRRAIGWDSDRGAPPDLENDKPGHPPWAEVAAARLATTREQLRMFEGSSSSSRAGGRT